MTIRQRFSSEMIQNYKTWLQQLPVEEQQKVAAADERQRQIRQEQIDCGNLDIDPSTFTQTWKNQETVNEYQQNLDPVLLSYFQRWRRENNITDEICTIETVVS